MWNIFSGSLNSFLSSPRFEKIKKTYSTNTRKVMLDILEIGKKLNINMDFYKNKLDNLTGKI